MQKRITSSEAKNIIDQEEGHYIDFKAKDISGAKLQQFVVAFCNADGGELYIGVADRKTLKGDDSLELWQGFRNQEAANQIIQTITADIKPPPPIEFVFLELDGMEGEGSVLSITALKSADVHYASDNKCYVRRGAQKQQITGDEIVNLKLSKGLESYENQLVAGFSVDELEESDELLRFLKAYSPSSTPREYLRKQRLIRKNGDVMVPTVAAILLYADNPSAIIPKKCAVKVSRYETSDAEPTRDHLREQETFEGSMIYLINESISYVKSTIENMSVLGESGLEEPKYSAEAIKEIVVNALIHRDYNVSDDVLITIYNNRLEIKNPGRLPGFITLDNILEERFSRNSTIQRLLHKYPDPPNKDIGEGLNTAFQKMREMELKNPSITLQANSVTVTLPHEPIAKPEETILEYLQNHDSITNIVARKICGIHSENTMKNHFNRLRNTNLIELVPGTRGGSSAWRRVPSTTIDDDLVV